MKALFLRVFSSCIPQGDSVKETCVSLSPLWEWMSEADPPCSARRDQWGQAVNFESWLTGCFAVAHLSLFGAELCWIRSWESKGWRPGWKTLVISPEKAKVLWEG